VLLLASDDALSHYTHQPWEPIHHPGSQRTQTSRIQSNENILRTLLDSPFSNVSSLIVVVRLKQVGPYVFMIAIQSSRLLGVRGLLRFFFDVNIFTFSCRNLWRVSQLGDPESFVILYKIIIKNPIPSNKFLPQTCQGQMIFIFTSNWS